MIFNLGKSKNPLQALAKNSHPPAYHEKDDVVQNPVQHETLNRWRNLASKRKGIDVDEVIGPEMRPQWETTTFRLTEEACSLEDVQTRDSGVDLVRGDQADTDSVSAWNDIKSQERPDLRKPDLGLREDYEESLKTLPSRTAPNRDVLAGNVPVNNKQDHQQMNRQQLNPQQLNPQQLNFDESVRLINPSPVNEKKSVEPALPLDKLLERQVFVPKEALSLGLTPLKTSERSATSPGVANPKASRTLPSDPSLNPEEDLKRRFGGIIRSALGPGTVIEGKFSFDSPVRIDGCLTGTVSSTSALIVGDQASVDAEIHVGTLIVFGQVNGNIIADDLLEIRAGGEVLGEIQARRFVVEDGGYIEGKCSLIVGN